MSTIGRLHNTTFLKLGINNKLTYTIMSNIAIGSPNHEDFPSASFILYLTINV